jgi:N-acetyl-gamma-glutamyl-phosphate reductase
MSIKASILGASGFAGAELLRRLLRHPEFEVVRVGAADHLGEPVASAHPHLEGLCELNFEELTSEQAVMDVDVVVMGLPHDVSARVAERAAAAGVRILDLSGAFRLRTAEGYEKHYGASHPSPELLEGFVYGLPEFNRERLKGAQKVASPGCFATAIQLPLGPFARRGWLSGSVRTVAATGSSGAGATPLVTTHHPTRAQNLRTYRPLTHPHAPEVVENLTALGARSLEVSFVPVSAPLTRGIFATSFFDVPADLDEVELAGVLSEAYRDEYFVRQPAKRQPEVVAVSGSNFAEVGVVLGPVRGGAREVVVFSALDNLIKGGAGQAVQNLNLMFGFEERTSLDDPGGYP